MANKVTFNVSIFFNQFVFIFNVTPPAARRVLVNTTDKHSLISETLSFSLVTTLLSLASSGDDI